MTQAAAIDNIRQSWRSEMERKTTEKMEWWHHWLVPSWPAASNAIGSRSRQVEYIHVSPRRLYSQIKEEDIDVYNYYVRNAKAPQHMHLKNSKERLGEKLTFILRTSHSTRGHIERGKQIMQNPTTTIG